MRYLLLLLLALLVGCATTKGYEQMLSTWIGASEDNLVRKWGPPDSFYDNGRSRYLTFVRSNQGYVPGTAPTYQSTLIGNTVYTTRTGGTPGYYYNNVCKTTFEIVDGRITHWRWEGNACRARSRD